MVICTHCKEEMDEVDGVSKEDQEDKDTTEISICLGCYHIYAQ